MTEETLRVVRDGLDGRPGARKRIVVLGAGLAGLVAAYELKHQGHEIVVLEAQNRVGGRVLTCREFAPGLYAEFGAMRIPRSHDLTLKYCAKFNLALTPFVMGNPKGLVHICGQRMTLEDAQRSPERLPFDLAPHERGKTADQLWTAAIADIKALLDRDGPSAWEQIRAEFDQFSLYEFLKHRNFSRGAIEYYAVMNFVEADMNNAVMEVLREDLEGAYVDMQTIDGGMDRLPRAFYAELQQEVRFGAEVRAIDQTDADVTVHYKTEAGRFSVTADYCVCALPFPCLRTDRARPTVLAREDARHPPAELPRFDEDPLPGPPSVLGGRGRDRRRGDRDRLADPAHELSGLVDGHDARRAARVVYVGPGRSAMGRDGSGNTAGRSAGRRGANPSAHS